MPLTRFTISSMPPCAMVGRRAVRPVMNDRITFPACAIRAGSDARMPRIRLMMIWTPSVNK